MSQATYERIRENYRRACDSSHPNPALQFARSVREAIGIYHPKNVCPENPEGFYLREDGFPQLAKDRPKRVSDFNLEAVSEALLGHQAAKALGRGGRWISEEAVAPIGPSFFMNVAAWTATIGGLVKGAILEGYETADLELVDLFPTRPVVFWQGGERYVDILGPSKPAPRVGPGESHPDSRMDAMWVEPAMMSKYGHKLTVTRETSFIDITGGQIIQRANNLGFGLKYREMELILDVLNGQLNNFKLGLTHDAGATGYNTYGATVPTGLGTTGVLANDIVNPLTDALTSFNKSQEALLQYKHPVTGLPMPMANRLTTLILPSHLQWFATYLITAAQLTIGAQPGPPAPQITGSTFPTGWTTNQNPYAGLFKDVRVSQYFYTRMIASTTQADPDLSPGLGLTSDNARRWIRLDPARFAARRAAWDVTQTEFPANSYVMADQGLIFGTVANLAVQFQVLNPWAIQRNKVV